MKRRGEISSRLFEYCIDWKSESISAPLVSDQVCKVAAVLTPRRLKSIWRSELEKISPRDWCELLELSKARDFFYKHLWWHASYREERGPLSGVSDGRFALEDRPVSYWGGDYEVARNEITKELRDDSNLTFRKMLNHISSGLLDESPCRVRPGTPLLDLTTAHSAFLLKLEKLGICKSDVFVKRS
jgi:hypothetical protein